MASLGYTFVADDVPPDEFDGDFQPLPAGDYVASIAESDIKPTKDGTGMFVKLTWIVQNGVHGQDGRRFWQQENLQNSSPKAEEIGKRRFAEICRAVGRSNGVSETEELHGIPCIVRVAVKAEAGYTPKNEVKTVKPYDGSPVQQRQQPVQQTAQRPAPATQQRTPPAATNPPPPRTNGFAPPARTAPPAGGWQRS